jgi:hypothetical protein
MESSFSDSEKIELIRILDVAFFRKINPLPGRNKAGTGCRLPQVPILGPGK